MDCFVLRGGFLLAPIFFLLSLKFILIIVVIFKNNIIFVSEVKRNSMNILEFCDSNEVVIEIYYNDSFVQIIKRSLFNYVKEHQLNYWVDDFYDPKESDGHGQATGYYNYEQYFELPFEHIENDIIKYLNHK